jgi:hypothetical protein
MTILRQTPDDYLFNLEALTPAEDITLDHIKPRSLGGEDKSVNVLCACHECNQSKGHTEWKEWYGQQMFYSWERMKSIEAWMTPVGDTGRYNAFKRKNVCYATAA